MSAPRCFECGEPAQRAGLCTGCKRDRLEHGRQRKRFKKLFEHAPRPHHKRRGADRAQHQDANA